MFILVFSRMSLAGSFVFISAEFRCSVFILGVCICPPLLWYCSGIGTFARKSLGKHIPEYTNTNRNTHANKGRIVEGVVLCAVLVVSKETRQ
jgi:hypothetical protein